MQVEGNYRPAMKIIPCHENGSRSLSNANAEFYGQGVSSSVAVTVAYQCGSAQTLKGEIAEAIGNGIKLLRSCCRAFGVDAGASFSTCSFSRRRGV